MLSASDGVTTKAKRVTQSRYIGKAELAVALGWTRPKLDRRLDSDASFPVVARGTRAGGWQFDLAAVRAYLDGTAAPKAAAPAPAPKRSARKPVAAEPTPTVLPPGPEKPTGPVKHLGEETAKQRKDNAQAAMLEDELAQKRGQLVEVEELRTVLATMLARLSKGIDGIPVLMIKRLGLSDDTLPVLREIVDDLRKQMVLDLRQVLSDGD